jgi:hypothetical protein
MLLLLYNCTIYTLLLYIVYTPVLQVDDTRSGCMGLSPLSRALSMLPRPLTSQAFAWLALVYQRVNVAFRRVDPPVAVRTKQTIFVASTSAAALGLLGGLQGCMTRPPRRFLRCCFGLFLRRAMNRPCPNTQSHVIYTYNELMPCCNTLEQT